jgi:Mor family transcriptional regulator
MGQLDTFAVEDNLILSLFYGPISSYITEEINETIEGVSAYFYSSNGKKLKISKINILIKEEINGASYSNFQ